MKTKIALIFSNIILLSLLLVSWNSKVNNQKSNGFTQECDTIGLSIINKETALKLADNYYNSIPRNLRGNTTLSKNDSRSVWFSYAELNKFIELVKCKYSSCPMINDPNFSRLGVRIYFGRYSNASQNSQNRYLSDLPATYQQKHCVFFVPTIKVNKVDKKFSSETFNQDLMSKDDNSTFKSFDTTTWLVGTNKNHGNISPPDELTGAEYTITP